MLLLLALGCHAPGPATADSGTPDSADTQDSAAPAELCADGAPARAFDSTATGADIREPATSDVEDLEVHLQNEGRKRRKASKASKVPLKLEPGALHALRQHSVLRSYLN